MDEKLAFSIRAPGGYIGVLKEGYSYNGSHIVRADSEDALKIRVDASEKNSENAHWVTMNHSPVLIKGGYIVGGAGGKFNGTLSTKYGAEAKQEKPKAQRISSTGEIEGALKAAGFTYVDMESFKGFDEKLLVENVNQLLSLEQRFGIAKALDGTEFCGDDGFFLKKNMAGVGGLLKLERVRLAISGKYYNSYAKLMEVESRGNKSGQFMPCKQESLSVYTITHEYGHMLQALLYMEEYKKHGWSKQNLNALLDLDRKTDKAVKRRTIKIQRSVEVKAFREIQDIGRRNNPNFFLADHLSSYGKTNYAEAFAEMFANSQCGEPNPAGDAMNIWLKGKGFLKE